MVITAATDESGDTFRRARNAFIWSAVALLTVTSGLKLLTLTLESETSLIATPAPVFPELSWRELLLVASLAELAAAGLAVYDRYHSRVLWAIAWIGTCFSFYRILLLLIGYQGPCNCLGRVGTWFPFIGPWERWITGGVIVYLVVGGFGLLKWERRRMRHGGAWGLWVLLGYLIVFHTSANAAGYKVTGETVVRAEYQGHDQVVQRAEFDILVVTTNWQLTIRYPLAGSIDCYAFVEGSAYVTSGGYRSPRIDGGVLDRPLDMIEAMTEAARVLLFALVYTEDIARALDKRSATLAPFLAPRHPVLYSYDLSMVRSQHQPYLPERATWAIDTKDALSSPRRRLEYYFGSARLGKRALRLFVRTQSEPALYAVNAFTNLNGMNIPLIATLTHTYCENDGKSGRRRFEIVASALERYDSADLRPTLLPGSRVTHVCDNVSFLYTSPQGKWLSAAEAKHVGKPLTPRPRRRIPHERIELGRFLLVGLVVVPVLSFALRSVRRQAHSLTKGIQHDS
jgi:hypothetical protein